jgi:hypothetical protein
MTDHEEEHEEHRHEGTFAEGQETVEHHPEEAPKSRFARGQREKPGPEHWHEGEFAEGQETVDHHPEVDRGGDFAEGQERDE